MSIFKPGTLTPSAPNSPAPSAPSTGGGPIYGVDVYHEDNVTSWSEMLSNGIQFAFCKASEGESSDPKFSEYFSGAKSAGLIAGAYHFYNTAIDQASQAKFFASRLEAVGFSKSDLPPVFDFEKASGNFSSIDAINCQAFLKQLHVSTGRLPMIYMSESTFAALGNPSWMKNYPWWIARYRSLSQGPGIDGWTIWQYSGSASIPGLANSGDKNIFQGSLADLKAWISKT